MLVALLDRSIVDFGIRTNRAASDNAYQLFRIYSFQDLFDVGRPQPVIRKGLPKP
jgi:hypothetical protein